MDENQDYQVAQQNGAAQITVKKKPKLLFIILPIIVLLAIIVALVILDPLSLLGKAAKLQAGPENTEVQGYIDIENSAYFVNSDGSTVKLTGDIIEAYQTADRKHLIVLEQDGLLYFTDAKGENKTVISDEATTVTFVRNSGIVFRYNKVEVTEATIEDILEWIALYWDYDLDDVELYFLDNYSNDIEGARELYEYLFDQEWVDDESQINYYYRYTFTSQLLLELGEDISINIARDTLSAIISQNERIYLLPEYDQEKEQAGRYSEDKYMLVSHVSNSGKVGVWVETVNGENTIYLAKNSDYEKIAQFDNPNYEYPLTFVYFLDGDTGALISSAISDRLYRYYEGSETDSIRLGWTNSYPWIYFSNGDFNSRNEKEIEDFYIGITSDDRTYNVYHIDAAGERDKLLSNIQYLSEVKENTLYYIDIDYNLKMAKHENGSLMEEKRISFDVNSGETIRFSADNQYLYYIKDYSYNSSTGSLFYYDIEKDESIRISSDINARNIYYSIDGRTVYYFKDVNKADKTGSVYSINNKDIGTLYQYTIAGEPQRLGSDIVADSLTSGLRTKVLDAKSIIWMKYATKNETTLIVDLQHFDGEETTTIARDIVVNHPF